MEKKNNKVSSRKSLSRKVVMRDIMRDIKSLFIAAPISRITRITTLRDDEVRPCPRFARAASTGAPFRFGFTLIELLVVVLIIGILAAVALPQYQFAVDKSRVMGYVQNIQQLVKAQQIYKMSSGEYQPDFTALDIDLTKICRTNSGPCYNELYNCPGGFGININAGGNPCHVIVFHAGEEPWVALYYCPDGTACSSSGSSSHRVITAIFQLKDGVLTNCTFNNTSRGQKLCNWLQQQFQ